MTDEVEVKEKEAPKPKKKSEPIPVNWENPPQVIVATAMIGEYPVVCSVSGKKGTLRVTGEMISKVKDVHQVDIGTGYMNLCLLR